MLLAPLKTTADTLLDLIYPKRCVLCDEFGPEYLCATCLAEMPKPLQEPVCPRCGHPRESLPCDGCLGDPPFFVIAMATGQYSGALRDAIHFFKYREKPMLAEPLGQILVEHARKNSVLLGRLNFDAVVPVPMHPVRHRMRGYNHAERLAKVFARELDLRLDRRLLRRVRRTKPQVGLDGDKRRGNLAGAFTASAEVSGKTVLLIDDVSTTGTTQRECAKVMKKAGAKAVYCLSLAAG